MSIAFFVFDACTLIYFVKKSVFSNGLSKACINVNRAVSIEGIEKENHTWFSKVSVTSVRVHMHAHSRIFWWGRLATFYGNMCKLFSL